MKARTLAVRSRRREAVAERTLRPSTRLALARIVPPKKYWETIADELSAAGWTWGYCSVVTCDGWRWIVDAYCGDGRRYIVESDELLSAFLELEATLL